MTRSPKPLTGRSRDFLEIVLPAAAAGRLDAVRQYIEQEPRFVQAVGPHGRTMLWEAARGNRLETVELLAQAGANIEAPGSYFRETKAEISPWCVAVHRGHEAVAEYLQSLGAAYGIDSACFLGDNAHLAELLAAEPKQVDCPIDGGIDPVGLRPIHYAIAGGHADLVATLLQAGADVETDGERLASWALDLDTPEILRLLLDHGARLRPGDANEACLDPHWAPVLSDYGYTVDINAPDRLGFPPLVEACRGNHNAVEDPAAIADLLGRGADVHVRDHKGKTALHRASQANFLQCADVLLAAGASIEATDDRGETPLFDAVRAGRRDMVRHLLEAGADRTHGNRLGQTAALLAGRSQKAQAEAICELLSDGSRNL